MANERITEQLFRDLLTEKGYFLDKDKCIVEEQSSKNPKINNLLKNASKRGGTGQGYPEVIIQHKDFPDTLIVVEAKAETKHHESKELNRYADYAVDGALLYGSYLSKEYDVICIGVSGQTKEELKLSTYFYPKTSPTFSPLINHSTKVAVKELLPFEEFDHILHRNPEKEQMEYEKVMKFAADLHNYMRDHAQLQEKEKPILVSAIMLALQDKVFQMSVESYESSPGYDLGEKLIEAVVNTLVQNGIPRSKVSNLETTFGFIKSHGALKKLNPENDKSHLFSIIEQADKYVSPFMEKYQDHDIIGKFYGEFISYTGGDGKGLGIVLTPKHMTEFMVEVVGIDKNSVVLDTCTGTGAFLIAAMWRMFEDANLIHDTAEREAKIEEIKQNQLIGVEMQQNMYAMACANMIFRGDGKSNLYNKDMFEVAETVKAHKPTHAVINPPYSQKAANRQELDFIKQTLDCLQPEGKFACIVPISVAIDTKKAKVAKREALLDNHRLDAVFTMPGDVFEPYASTHTCIMVFTAHVSHYASQRHKTFFGYFKDDGFELTKKGRVDLDNKWPTIKEAWLDAFENKEIKAGFSVTAQVGPEDEWCAEAYMETDYSNLIEANFVKALRNYAGFKVLNFENEFGEAA
ncbi:N-6 DNA Methylase [Colwellia chukchiensis]|uniref:site-specific DNA-methyltransferase (adenine-specific) n=1 Tax=Colwellia chukchiensis TaxID=641665 RepID=A0A1H7TYV4_9GAMM|nr:N-6 DNA methylase [Colwellia chukchiensis]SEL90030.1 N-6 DNA Methylase [Colwellia chukchiensis]